MRPIPLLSPWYWQASRSAPGPTSRLQLELLQADLDAGAAPFSFSAQYRWYDGFHAVHHAWLGSGYHLGIEDDYDPGLVLVHPHGVTTWHVG